MKIESNSIFFGLYKESCTVEVYCEAVLYNFNFFNFLVKIYYEGGWWWGPQFVVEMT